METTRKHPRTLEEAFGPYARGHVFEKQDRSGKDEITLAASIVALFALLIIFAIWG
jgi:hypothetical protein